MSESLNNEQRELLLTAYFDNELGPEDRTRVELMLAENPSYSQLLRQWRENRDAIAELPRFSLDDGFAARVLAASVSAHQQASATMTKVQSHVVTESETNNWRIGLGAIATLAAMLLLTLFVFPAMIDSNVAVLPSASTDVISPENSTNLSDPVVVEQRQPEIVARKSSLAGGAKNGRPVDPIALKSLNRPNVERVLWIENKSLIDLETVLANHSIRLVEPDGDIQDQTHLVQQSAHGVEATLREISRQSKMPLRLASSRSHLGRKICR